MAITKPRNRVVLFRLTQEEYDSLQQACTAEGARSVSDYARGRILGSAPNGDAAAVATKLGELTLAVERLSRFVDRTDAGPRRAEAAAASYSGALLANSGD